MARDEEARRDLAVMRDILQTWGRLGVVRSEQGFASTSESLTVFRREADAEADKAAFVRDVEEELEEARSLHDEEATAVHRLALEAREVMLARQRQRHGDGGEAQPEDAVVVPDKARFSRSKALAAIVDRLKRCRRPFGQPILMARLSHDTEITPADACPPHEVQRRARASNYAM